MEHVIVKIRNSPWLSQEFWSLWSSQTLWHGRRILLSPVEKTTRNHLMNYCETSVVLKSLPWPLPSEMESVHLWVRWNICTKFKEIPWRLGKSDNPKNMICPSPGCRWRRGMKTLLRISSSASDLDLTFHTLASMRSRRSSTIVGSLVNSSNRYCHSQVSWPNVPLVTKNIPLQQKSQS